MSNNASVKHRVCLIVIDGWGVRKESHGNAILNGKTPVMDGLCSGNWQQLEASGEHVGVPDGQMGNSEVGHLNIGAGRVVYQDIVRINLAVRKNTLVDNEQLKAMARRAIDGNGRVHLLGLGSDGGVHSHINHLFGLLKALKQLAVPKVFIHFFGDGRDTNPESAAGYLKQLLDFISELGYGRLATIVGRYYAMDRDKRWERIKVAYEALIAGRGAESTAVSVVEAVKERYAAKETDEFLKPIIITDDGAESRVKDDDTLLFFNFRADRMRQISECMGRERYRDLESDVGHPCNLHVVGMTQYNKEFGFSTIFPPVSQTNVLAEWLAKHHISQFHCAETEKYAHVTFFFNGGCEKQFEGEERKLVPSPKVKTYDLQPEMSAAGVADAMIEQIEMKKHPFIMCNFAPPDMVGHTGEYEPAVRACEATDHEIGRIYEACKAHGYTLLVTADHGNAEKMINEDGGKFTAHTCYKVPFTCSSAKFRFKSGLPDREPALRDVAPTCLHIMGLPPAPEMDGVSLVDEQN